MGNALNLYNLTATEISASLIIINLAFSFILQLMIVFIYKKTRHGLSYSQSFMFTLIIIGVLGTAIMMAVQNNIVGAFAIFGAFTLIRFRSILKETSDLAYVFFSLVVGIAIGMNHYSIALVTAVFLSLIIYLFHRFGFGKVADNFDYLLLFYANDSFKLSSIDEYLSNISFSRELLHTKHMKENFNEYAISMKINDKVRIEEVMEKLRDENGISKVEILSGKQTSEF